MALDSIKTSYRSDLIDEVEIRETHKRSIIAKYTGNTDLNLSQRIEEELKRVDLKKHRRVLI